MKNPSKKMAHCKPFAVATPNIVLLINNGHRPNARKQVGNTPKLSNAFLKNTILFLSFLILGFGSELRAQESPKWEIGTDLLWLIGKNSLPEYSLLVRHKLTEQNVLRTRIGASTSNALGALPRMKDQSNFFFRLGYQREFTLIEDLLNVYYGGDLHFSFSKRYMPNPYSSGTNNNFQYIYIDDYLNLQENYVVEKKRAVGLVGLLGLNLNINRHLQVSLESNIMLSSQHIYVGIPYRKESSRSLNTIEMSISPISTLNFNVRF